MDETEAMARFRRWPRITLWATEAEGISAPENNTPNTCLCKKPLPNCEKPGKEEDWWREGGEREMEG